MQVPFNARAAAATTPSSFLAFAAVSRSAALFTPVFAKPIASSAFRAVQNFSMSAKAVQGRRIAGDRIVILGLNVATQRRGAGIRVLHQLDVRLGRFFGGPNGDRRQNSDRNGKCRHSINAHANAPSNGAFYMRGGFIFLRRAPGR